ncbi:hypothetical protein [Cytobacillus purgationiresistens]|uniref:Phage protein n=1 Tax=Cytobacillus purgationiresistens TaxID=863449 RepID=A0ABU0AIP6_9BACI|nr:hypothetical protein [Cytobacillus purgationiresistens]MDQ0271134.1 hypothetical protein [Cytobacillus purgationiresistens]
MYKVETYKFRYKGITAADIKTIDVPGEQVGFEFEIYKDDKFWPELPEKFYHGASNNDEILQELEMELAAFFKTKEDALQTAINMIEGLLNKYRKQGVFWDDLKKNK